VQVREDEEQQDGNKSGDDRRRDDNAVHRADTSAIAEIAGSPGEGSLLRCFHTEILKHNRF
jgi:hypothetical protein